MRPGQYRNEDGPKRYQPPINRSYQQLPRAPKDFYKQNNSGHSWKEAKPVSNQVVPACTYPSLPKKDEVLELKNEIEEQIKACQIDLSTLRQASQTVGTVSPVENQPDSLGITDISGFVSNMNLVDSVIKQNRHNAKLAEKEASVDMHQKMLFSSHAPYAIQDLKNHDNLLPLLFSSVFYTKAIEKEKEEALAEQYDYIRDAWNMQCDAIDALESTAVLMWPDVMPTDITKNAKDEQYIQFAAPDYPMYINPADKEAYKLWSEARLVDDPSGEHTTYKHRVEWSAEEKEIFLEQWCAHPKDFAKIAAKIPDKSVKECIEFYYLNKNLYDLKNLQAATKKRAGRRKKVASEGAIHQ